jgi:hypothetical protein
MASERTPRRAAGRAAKVGGAGHSRSVDLSQVMALSSVAPGVDVIRAGERAPQPDDRPVEGAPAYENEIKPPEEQQTVADGLNYLCAALKGKHRRKVDPGSGEVILSIETFDGDAFGGRGATTRDAYNALLEKVQSHIKSRGKAAGGGK